MTAPLVLDRPAGDTDDTAKRRQIVEGARAVFLANGFDAASMGEIAKAAGVSKGTLYVYFKDKDELFKAIVAKECLIQAEGIFAFDVADPDVEGMLTRVCNAFVQALCAPDRQSPFRAVIAIADRMPIVGRMFYEAGPAVGIAKMGAYLAAQVAAGRPGDSRLRGRGGATHGLQPRHVVQAAAVQRRAAAFAGADRIRRRNCREGLYGGIRKRAVTASRQWRGYGVFHRPAALSALAMTAWTSTART